MSALSSPSLQIANSVDDALAALADAGPTGTPIAGGTWLMRAPIRGEAIDRRYVAIGQIDSLRENQVTDQEIHLGACLTHVDIAHAVKDIAQCNGLSLAATGAANPAIRQMATLGGNIAAGDFSASDLSPALLCLDAQVELQTTQGSERLSIANYLDQRRSLRDTIVTGVVIPRTSHRTGHARLPLRKAGDYPVAIVSLAYDLGPDGSIADIRIAVGSVEATARRWAQLEEALRGKPLDPKLAQDLATTCTETFTGRESVEAPAWYRVQVLPTLVRRALEAAA